MLLENKTAVIFAAAGAIGSQVARTFAREGARVYLSGRDLGAVEAVAGKIRDVGGQAKAAAVDALDSRAVEAYVNEVERDSGGIDIEFNAIGIRPAEGGYGTPALDLSYESYLLPLTTHVGSQFLTAQAAARHMVQRGSGVILTLSASLGKEARPFMAGISSACAAIEGLTRSLAAELSPMGIRVLCVRGGAMFETRTIQETVKANAATAGLDPETFAGFILQASLMKRAPTVEETAQIAAFLASDRASAMTGQIINSSCGLVLH